MKVREKQSRGGYIDRCVDETIVFELSGWTQTLPSQPATFILCVCVCFVVQWNERWALFQFLSLSISQVHSLFAVMCLFPPCSFVSYSHTCVHTHRTDLLTLQHRSSSNHDCMYHMWMANVPPTSGWFTANCFY